MTDFSTLNFSSAAIEVLGQLFCEGPLWDGNLVSKEGRNDLVNAGLVEQWNGWQQLTIEGLKIAATVDVKHRYHQWWHRKQRQIYPERKAHAQTPDQTP